jgi:uncharacterized RDD family membrane protein YckC
MASGVPFVAPIGKRVLAEAFDMMFICVVIFLFLGWSISINDMGLWIFALPPLCYASYHAVFLQAWEGQTPGRRLAGIQIVAANSNRLTHVVCFARPLIRAVSLALMVLIGSFWDWSPLVVLPVAVDMLLIHGLPTRQSLPDLICRTLVVNLPPVQPHRAPAALMYSATDAEFGIPPRKVK